MTKRAAPQKRSPPTRLELGYIPHVLAAASFTSISISTIYEVGYFSEIGYQFFPLLSPSDFLFSLLFWVPLIFAVLIGSVLGAPLMRFASIKISGAQSPTPRMWNALVGFGFLVFLSSLYWYLLGRIPAIAMLTIFFMVASIGLYVWIFRAMSGVSFILTVIIVCCLSLMLGRADGVKDLRQFNDVLLVTKKREKDSNSSGELGRNLVLMRNLQREILTRDPINNRIEFLPWDGIDKVSIYKNSFQRRMPPICVLLSMLCGDIPDP